MNLEKLLNEEIQTEFECLRDLEAGTKEYDSTVDGLVKLMDRAIEIEKFNIEQDAKEDLVKEERIDRIVKHVLTFAGIATPAVLAVWGTLVSLTFEKENTVSTLIGRGFLNKLIPKNW